MKILWFGIIIFLGGTQLYIQGADSPVKSANPYPYAFFDPAKPSVTTSVSIPADFAMPFYHGMFPAPWIISPLYVYPTMISFHGIPLFYYYPSGCNICPTSSSLKIKIQF